VQSHAPPWVDDYYWQACGTQFGYQRCFEPAAGFQDYPSQGQAM
jgi:hypothetical protein